ncbi:MAG: 16S rRNA (uracil(1498)-N(3))-methyltransferase [Deltaproteobacteria bacterium]|nr:16S rRNA (uracil(1498)-N(3))-methyltransferase [Deltaproteobacteria bacterium]
MTTTRRFFLEDMVETTDALALSGAEFRHLSNVLRITEGTEIEVLNGKGLTCRAVVESITKNLAILRPLSWDNNLNESPLKITLIQGMTKLMKPELVVEKATELGVNKIFFYETERSVLKKGALTNSKSKKYTAKLARLKRVAASAIKQCGRSVVPEVGFITLSDALKQEALLKVVLHDEGKVSLKDILSNLPEGSNEVVLLIGSEGGFTEAELKDICEKGFVAGGFGKRVLRAETAAIAAVTALQYALGDMG